MMKTRMIKFIIIMCVVVHFGCGSKVLVPLPSTKELIREVFSHESVASYSALKPGADRDFYVKLKNNPQDSLHILRSIYWINADTAKINKAKMINITIDSVSKTEYLLKFIYTYYPSLSEQIRGDYKFVYENNVWILKDNRIGNYEGNGQFSN